MYRAHRFHLLAKKHVYIRTNTHSFTNNLTGFRSYESILLWYVLCGDVCTNAARAIVRAYIYVHIYTYIYIYTHIHIYIYTYTYMDK